MPDPRPLFIYDGDCGICTATVGWLRRRRAERTLRFAASTEHPPEMAASGLTLQDCVEAAYVVESHASTGSPSRMFRGAAAINFALSRLPGASNLVYRTVARLYWLPGVRQMQDRGYAWVAHNRHRFRVGPQVCDAPPPKGRV